MAAKGKKGGKLGGDGVIGDFLAGFKPGFLK
jgi:hypothetical protein